MRRPSLPTESFWWLCQKNTKRSALLRHAGGARVEAHERYSAWSVSRSTQAFQSLVNDSFVIARETLFPLADGADPAGVGH